MGHSPARKHADYSREEDLMRGTVGASAGDGIQGAHSIEYDSWGPERRHVQSRR